MIMNAFTKNAAAPVAAATGPSPPQAPPQATASLNKRK